MSHPTQDQGQANVMIDVQEQHQQQPVSGSATTTSSKLFCSCKACQKYEYPYLKNETCCRCCGIRIAILILCLCCVFDGFAALIFGPFIRKIFDSSLTTIVTAVDVSVAVIGILFGAIGFYGTWTMKEPILRMFYYLSFIIFLLIVVCDSLLVVFFFMDLVKTHSNTQKVTDEVLIALFFSDMISGVVIWGYCTYKIRQFYLLVFAYYHELSDGDAQKK
eukprot:176662_1